MASDLFEQIAKFAGYGFNRSHAVGYALVAYVAGWLKTHFPVHFLASLLTAQQRSADKDERIARIRVGAEARGIPILPPDVQTSGAEAEVDGHGVRYGLGAVKQVGLRAAEAIAAARERCGRFESLNQLAREVEPGILNRGALESLVGAGALDFLGVSRSRIVATIPEALRCASRSRDREAAGVQLLFGEAAESTADRFAEAPSWSEAERLHREFKAFGFYWTGHPAREYRAGLASLVSGAIGTLGDRMPRNEIRVVGVVRAVRKLKTREGRPMATFQLEDDTGSVRVVAFPDTWEESGPVEADEAVVVGGRLRRAGEDSAGGSGEAAAGPGGEIVASSLLPATAAPFLQTLLFSGRETQLLPDLNGVGILDVIEFGQVRHSGIVLARYGAKRLARLHNVVFGLRRRRGRGGNRTGRGRNRRNGHGRAGLGGLLQAGGLRVSTQYPERHPAAYQEYREHQTNRQPQHLAAPVG